ncbi:hypothetical protein PG991_000714 [Apiospora marii]|uniref:Uncharacterized protein n=1 Tax=Apiospora marii TaxID=335849 RepID=A0ABR1SV32_9PEZI
MRIIIFASPVFNIFPIISHFAYFVNYFLHSGVKEGDGQAREAPVDAATTCAAARIAATRIAGLVRLVAQERGQDAVRPDIARGNTDRVCKLRKAATGIPWAGAAAGTLPWEQGADFVEADGQASDQRLGASVDLREAAHCLYIRHFQDHEQPFRWKDL